MKPNILCWPAPWLSLLYTKLNQMFMQTRSEVALFWLDGWSPHSALLDDDTVFISGSPVIWTRKQVFSKEPNGSHLSTSLNKTESSQSYHRKNTKAAALKECHLRTFISPKLRDQTLFGLTLSWGRALLRWVVHNANMPLSWNSYANNSNVQDELSDWLHYISVMFCNDYMKS